ncbi:MAG: SCP2 sterol-binding domain-containing protein [Aggregatilineales bacterium]
MASSQEIAAIFDKMIEKFDPDKASGVTATIQFDLSGDNGGQYWIKIADGQAQAGAGTADNPTMTLRAAADDWASVVNGQLNPMQAFMSGKLKIQGDMALALKLQPMFLS